MSRKSRRSGGADKVDENDSNSNHIVERSMGDAIVLRQEMALNTYDENTDYEKSGEVHSLQKYCSRIKIKIINESEDEMTLEFDLIHVEAPIANALRRILLAEVPTMAIEKVYLYQNTSVIYDEDLCHRLGLVPVHADPRLFEFPTEPFVDVNEMGTDCEEEPPGDEKRNLIFELHVKCSHKKDCHESISEPRQLYENASVYSNSFKWVPIGDQEKRLPFAPKMVHDDILIAKLRPNQEIELRCHCVKGVGRDHAKFSPVAPATYRLLPQIKLKRNFCDEEAEKLKSCFSEGVIGIDTAGVAFVRDARRDTCSRNVLRHKEFAEDVELMRVKDHFIFSVESTGALKSSELTIEACKVMEGKCRSLVELFRNQVKLMKSKAA